jgi:hypothetical protein
MALQDTDFFIVGRNGETKKTTYYDLKADLASSSFSYWTRSGTTLSPANSGDNLDNIGSATFAGNVGIGATAHPNHKLEVRDSNNIQIAVAKTGIGSVKIGVDSDNFIDYTNQVLAFRYGGSEKARLTQIGQFLIGDSNTASPNIQLNADGSASFTGKVTSASTEDTDAGTTLVTKDYVDANASYWDRSGTTLSPVNSGDDLDNINNAEFAGTVTAKDVVITNVKNAMSLATDSDGKIVPASTVAPAPLFTWNAETDDYDRTDVGFRDIKVQARMRRCLMQDDGTVTYLDADDSTKLAGDWIRLCETTELDMEYTGTHGAEIFNTRLRDLAPTWAPGTHHQGELVTHNGKVWECLATTTTATPASGTAAATLDGTAGQVMVEIPTFSVCHETDPSGSFFSHDWGIMLGASTLPNYVTHPAFIRPDGSIRKAIYIGAYQGTGTDGNGSFSGVNNTTGQLRSESRIACASRGAGWHQLGYTEYNAVQHLLLNEYQDINSQRCLGNGAMLGYIYEVTTGLSDSRGNRCENSHTPAGSNTDYVSYRGLENIYGRAWQSVDGLNVNDRAVYVCTDPSKWADDTITDYKSIGSVPNSSGNYIRDVSSSGVYLLPQSVAGASATTFVGDAIYNTTGWRVGSVGGGASLGDRGGLFPLFLIYDSDYPDEGFGGRLCYAD